MANIWEKCQGINHLCLINEIAWRIVEAQEITATRKLVDSLEEQMILEDLIEENKPQISAENLNLHPLLYTPFRYPPLKHGSRFSKKTEPSLWYGSLDIKTAMAEKAYYQFHFLQASEATYDMVQIPLTIFSTMVKTAKGIKLNTQPFADYTHLISSPNSYETSQSLGSAMRINGVEAFTYISAREINKNTNIALFTSSAFLNKRPNVDSFQTWQCIINNNVAEFVRSNAISIETSIFSLDYFTINGYLPNPAN